MWNSLPSTHGAIVNFSLNYMGSATINVEGTTPLGFGAKGIHRLSIDVSKGKKEEVLCCVLSPTSLQGTRRPARAADKLDSGSCRRTKIHCARSPTVYGVACACHLSYVYSYILGPDFHYSQPRALWRVHVMWVWCGHGLSSVRALNQILVHYHLIYACGFFNATPT